MSGVRQRLVREALSNLMLAQWSCAAHRSHPLMVSSLSGNGAGNISWTRIILSHGLLPTEATTPEVDLQTKQEKTKTTGSRYGFVTSPRRRLGKQDPDLRHGTR